MGTLGFYRRVPQRFNAIFLKFLSKLIHRLFGTRENQHLLPILEPIRYATQTCFALVVDFVEALLNFRGHRIATLGDFNQFLAALKWFYSDKHFIVEGCGEKQRLARFG